MSAAHTGHTTPDRELVDAILRGEEAACRELFERYADRLYRLALRRMDLDEDLAIGIVHTTLCHAIEHLGSFRGESSLYTWLYACCRQHIRDHYRKHRRIARREIVSDNLDSHPHRENFGTGVGIGSGDVLAGGPGDHSVPRPGEGPEEAFDRRRRSLRVHEAMDLLPSYQREILTSRYFRHQSVRQIADNLGVSTKAAESRLGRARSALKRLLEELDFPSQTHPHDPAEPIETHSPMSPAPNSAPSTDATDPAHPFPGAPGTRPSP